MYVITGGAGFIGSNIAATLEAKGAGPLVIVDRLRHGDKWRNIAKRHLHDIVDPDNLSEYLAANSREVTGIVHMGAISATTETDADLIVETNFRLSRDLWIWCAENNKPFISLMISEDLVKSKNWNAGLIIRELAKEIKGGGGGQPFFATAGGSDVNGLKSVTLKAREIFK